MIITLTTDYGLKESSLAVLKGGLLSKLGKDIHIIDITHEIENFNLSETAYVLGSSWRHFPEKTIHICTVHSFYTKNPNLILIKHQNHFFLGPDNGIFSLIFRFSSEDARIVGKLRHNETTDLKRILCEVVALLADGIPFNEIGDFIETPTERLILNSISTKSQIQGTIVHIDRYENLVLNITKKQYEIISNNRPFRLFYKRHSYLDKLSNHYGEVPLGEPLCFFNQAGYLQLSVNCGKAASLLSLKLDDTLFLKFIDDIQDL